MNNSNENRAAAEGTEHLKQAAHAATDGLRRAAKGLREASRLAGDELSEAGSAAARGARDLWGQAGEAVRKNPMAAVGIAIAAGAILSRLLRR